MDRKLDLVVGQSVAVRIEDMSNAARGLKMTMDNVDEWCFDGVVTKIGRKYITVKFRKYSEEQFVIENDYRQKHTFGGANYKLYLSKDDVLEEKEADNIYSRIKTGFSDWKNYKYTLDQLKRIESILDECE